VLLERLRTRHRWRALIAGALVAATAVIAFGCLPANAAQAPRAHKRPAARLRTDVRQIRVNDVVRADLRSSRLPKGRPSLRITFGDGTKGRRLHRLEVVTHRYLKAGRFTMRFVIRGGGRSYRASAKVLVRRRVVRTMPAPRTVVARGSQVSSISGEANGPQTVVLRPHAPAQAVGHMLAVPASMQQPNGVLGRVVGAQALPDGSTSVDIQPAAVNQAYKRVQVSTGGSLDDPGVFVENDQGQLVAARSSTGHIHLRSSLHIGGTGVRCTGFDQAPPVDIDIDLSQLHWDLSFTYPSPSIHFLVTGSPKVTVNLGLNLRTECHWTLPLHVVIPIPGTPLQVKISPRLQLNTEGHLGGAFVWSPRMTYGFDRGNGINSEVHVFNPGTPTVRFDADAKADLFFGPDAELTLGGRVGVSAIFGPDFEITRTNANNQTCTDANVGLKLEATAEADVFVAHWNFTLFSGLIGKRQILHNCSAGSPPGGGSTPPPGGGGSTPPPGGGSTPPPGGGSTPPPGGGGATPNVTLTQGPAAPAGYRYAITLDGFAPNSTVPINCYDSASPGGFYPFNLSTDASGHASTAAYCYSGDGPDHWIVAGGIESNHVTWGGSTQPPPQTQPTPTWAETAGGVAHTWTNYTNAGGNQGPSIASNQTVAIACKVTGFRVADGNTWWYRIASSPWNNAYYVSADAFYNNGATSGSLHGTPFVDPAVANC
jgi:hypothetical protein